MEHFSFTHTDSNDITITVNFVMPSDGTTIWSYHDMCKRAALAFSYCDKNVEETFGETCDDSFMEFDK